jgi:tRNA(fMet)-specific endonuclease VapC
VFVLDTNTVIDYFRGHGQVAQRLLQTPPSEVAIPAIAAYEVWVGVLGSQNAERRRQQYAQFLSAVEVLPFDADASLRAAQLRRELEQRGQAIGPLDTLIAATALTYDATLVTRNLGEFGRVPGLRVESWHG